MALLEMFERSKIPSWVPWRWRHIAIDGLFYDVFTAWKDVIDAYSSEEPMPEGGIIVIQPNGGFQVYDYRDYLEQPLQDIETIVVAGCGSSRVGSIAFGQTVAKALDQPVASLIAGYGLRDLIGEAMAGALIFFPMNLESVVEERGNF
jgi:hypothetical protein